MAPRATWASAGKASPNRFSLLDELATSDDPKLWAPALHEITGEQIALKPEDIGRPTTIARAWLALSEARGWPSR